MVFSISCSWMVWVIKGISKGWLGCARTGSETNSGIAYDREKRMLDPRADAILLRKEREGLAFMLSMREMAAWEVLTFLARSRWDIFFASRFSIICLATRYSASDSFQA